MKISCLLCIASLVAVWPSRAAVSPEFLGPVQFSTGTPPAFDPGTQDYRYARGDFTGDLIDDLVIVHPRAEPENITVMPGDGAGELADPIVTELDEVPSVVAVGDFDEDGRLDLVGSLDFSSDPLPQTAVFLGLGDGTFTPGLAFAGPSPHLATADFDRDGHLDLARSITVMGLGGIEIWVGDGTGEFVLQGTFMRNVYMGVNLIWAADVNADGLPDLVYGYVVSARVNLGGGDFGPESMSPLSGILSGVNDLDGDGRCDVSTRSSDGLLIGLGVGDGTFAAGASYPEVFVRDIWWLEHSTADYTNDGLIDILAGDGKDESVFLRGAGNGTFAPAERRFVGGLYLTPLQLDLDAFPELATGGITFGEVSVTQGGDVGPLAPETFPTSGFGEVMATGDVDGDGDPDLVASHKLTGRLLSILLGDGTGGFAPSTTAPVVREAKALALGDLNHDGRNDVVVGSLPSQGKNLEILLGTADGVLQPLLDTSNGATNAIYAHGLALGDMDRDGHLDIVTSTFGPLSVLLGRGDGTFDPPLFSGQGLGSTSSLLVADFDGDDADDAVAVADYDLNADDVLSVVYSNQGNGDGTLELVQTLSLDCGVPSAASGRITVDGSPDIVVVGLAGNHTGLGGLYILENISGAFSLAAQDPSAPGSTVAAGDLNGDGADEAVTCIPRLLAPSELRVHVNDGGGTFERTIRLPAPGSPYDMVLGSFVGTDLADVTVLNSVFNPSTVLVFENRTGGATDATPAWPATQGTGIVARPNPFFGSTTLVFEVDARKGAELGIYDVGGRLLRNLASDRLDHGMGSVEWDGTDASGAKVGSGVYFVKYCSEGRAATAKVHHVP